MSRLYAIFAPVLAFLGDLLLLAGFLGYFVGLFHWDTAVILMLAGLGAILSALREKLT